MALWSLYRKKPNLRWLTPLLLLCLICPTVVEAGLYPVIDHPLYGIRLGEQHSNLSHDIRTAGKQITRDLNIKNKMHSHGKVWSIDGALQNKKGIDLTRIFMFNGQVYEIEVIFKSDSDRKFNHIKNALIDKYGEYEIDATGGALFSTAIDGQDVSIRLNRISVSDTNFNITLQYFYKRFVRDVMRIHKKRMSRDPRSKSFTSR